MDEARFQMTMHSIRAINTLIASMSDLDEFVRACETADSIGPILDPTAWQKGHDDLALLTRHARGLAVYRAALMRDAEASGQTAPGDVENGRTVERVTGTRDEPTVVYEDEA